MAVRLLWALHEYGHDRVRVLNEGWPALLVAGAPIERGLPASPRAAFFTPSSVGRHRMPKDQVMEVLYATSSCVVDCRAAKTYQATRAHVPGVSPLPALGQFDPESRDSDSSFPALIVGHSPSRRGSTRTAQSSPTAEEACRRASRSLLCESSGSTTPACTMARAANGLRTPRFLRELHVQR